MEQNGGPKLLVCPPSASERYLPRLQQCTSTGGTKHTAVIRMLCPGITQGRSTWQPWQPQCAWPNLANAGESLPTLIQLGSSLYCTCKLNPLLPCKVTYKPTAGIRIWTPWGMITLPTTPSSLSRAHLHLPSCLCHFPPRVQREQLACGWAGAGAEWVGWGGGIFPVIGQGAEAGRMGPRALQASCHCLPGWRRGLRGKANGAN